jgi:hypothetical protein
VCFDDQFCGSFEFDSSVQLENNTTCYLYKDLYSDRIIDSGKFCSLTVEIDLSEPFSQSYQQCSDERNLFLNRKKFMVATVCETSTKSALAL